MQEALLRGLTLSHAPSPAALSKAEFSRRLMSGEVPATSEVFNFATEGNRVELMVDGKDTYRRMFDVPLPPRARPCPPPHCA